jgi:hypothetical protein
MLCQPHLFIGCLCSPPWLVLFLYLVCCFFAPVCFCCSGWYFDVQTSYYYGGERLLRCSVSHFYQKVTAL